MRQLTPLLIVPVLAIGLVGMITSTSNHASSLPGGSPTVVPEPATPSVVASPVASPLTVGGVAATGTALQATVAAQRVEIAVLTIRVAALETSVATLLEALPEQTALDGFQQNQIDDLAARVAALETLGGGTPLASPMAPPAASPTPS